MRRAVTFLAALLLLTCLGAAPRVEAHHVRKTTAQQQYRDLYSSIVGISAHRIIEKYLIDQHFHVPPYAPVSLSPTPTAEDVLFEQWVSKANVTFSYPLPSKPGNGGRLDFAAKYTDRSGCWWEVHEIKPSGWHYRGRGQAALAQLYSYINGILWDTSGDFEGCKARPATRWKEGQPGWRTIPARYAPIYDAYNVKLQVQTWYRTEPGIIYYRFVWKDRNKRQTALKEGLSRNLAELVNKIARNELDLSNRFVYGELIPWMWAMRHEDKESGGAWEDVDALQELIDIKLSLDDPATRTDEDENADINGKQRNQTDMSVTTVGMLQYWEAWTTPDPWYFKDWQKADVGPRLSLPGGTHCYPQPRDPVQPFKCS